MIRCFQKLIKKELLDLELQPELSKSSPVHSVKTRSWLDSNNKCNTCRTNREASMVVHSSWFCTGNCGLQGRVEEISFNFSWWFYTQNTYCNCV